MVVCSKEDFDYFFVANGPTVRAARRCLESENDSTVQLFAREECRHRFPVVPRHRPTGILRFSKSAAASGLDGPHHPIIQIVLEVVRIFEVGKSERAQIVE